MRYWEKQANSYQRENLRRKKTDHKTK